MPCFHLDALFWKPEWVKSEPEEFKQRVREDLMQDEKGWIADGNYAKKMSEVLNSATDVICTPFVRYLAEAT